jgi:xanthine dehydrogenase accessory factor
VVISDDRQELCAPEHIPDADVYLPGAIADVLPQTSIDHQTYVVAVTRGYPFDVAAVPILLETPAPYIGVIGSRRRWTTTVKELKATGIEGEALERVHSPIGLYLSAETPEEIAVSIMAEIIMLRNRGSIEAVEHRRSSVGDERKENG